MTTKTRTKTESRKKTPGQIEVARRMAAIRKARGTPPHEQRGITESRVVEGREAALRDYRAYYDRLLTNAETGEILALHDAAQERADRRPPTRRRKLTWESSSASSRRP